MAASQRSLYDRGAVILQDNCVHCILPRLESTYLRASASSAEGYYIIVVISRGNLRERSHLGGPVTLSVCLKSP